MRIIAPLREEIGLLKDGLNDLRRELKDLKESSSRAQQEEACLYVRLQNYLPKHPLPTKYAIMSDFKYARV